MFFTDAIKALVNALPAAPGTSPNGFQTNHATHHIAIHQALLGLAGWKIYLASVTQSGTNPPVSTIIWNTLSGTPIWSYTATGAYDLTLADEFTAGKVAAFASQMGSYFVGYARVSANALRFTTRTVPAGTLADNCLAGDVVLILIAP